MSIKNNKSNVFDVIVIGGVHAGIEAAYSAAKMGSKTQQKMTLLLKMSTVFCIVQLWVMLKTARRCIWLEFWRYETNCS